MINPKLLKWARERANLTLEEAIKKIGEKYIDWEKGKAEPTQKQLEKIAKKFYVPFGYLFLSDPPEEKLPIPDFRTMNNEKLKKPSINLLETIYDAQRKQDWLREEKIEDDEDKIIFKKAYSDEVIIKEIKNLLEIEELRKESKNYEEFLSGLMGKLDKKEFLIIRNGVVGNNNQRSLSPDEFKGFCLFDEYAPAIFINGKDYKSSQIFTLIHELVHLYLNESGLDGDYHLQTEQRCNRLAAEILLPKKELEQNFSLAKLEEIANDFKISVFVVLIKARQSNLIKKSEFQEQWDRYKENIKEQPKKTGGGDFYRNVKFKAGGESFLLRVANSTLAGRTLYRDAYSLTGLKGKTFNEYYRKIEVPL